MSIQTSGIFLCFENIKTYSVEWERQSDETTSYIYEVENKKRRETNDVYSHRQSGSSYRGIRYVSSRAINGS